MAAKKFSYLIRNLATKIPVNKSERIPGFSPWVKFLEEKVGDRLDFSNPSYSFIKKSKESIPPITHDISTSKASVRIIHRFSEEHMFEWGDDLIELAKERIRINSESSTFQEEEILVSWMSKMGQRLPSSLPSIGNQAQSGYIMYMGPNAKQSAHQHGLRKQDGGYEPGTGCRFLIGITGADRSTVRHCNGVEILPRGSLVLIHFPEDTNGPGAAHQFINEGGKVGNLLLSFHQRDFLDEDKQSESLGSSTMNLRTFIVSGKTLRSLRHGHGFLVGQSCNV